MSSFESGFNTAPIDGTMIEAQHRAELGRLSQPDASVIGADTAIDARLDYLGGELDMAIASGDHEGEVALRRSIGELLSGSE